MELYQISTTAYDEEDFLIVTDAPFEEIEKVLEPMVKQERENDVWYDHSDYLNALNEALPQYRILHFIEPQRIVL
jgi:hypothetical protein